MNHIGVDVDSQYLVCKARFGEEELPVRQFDNNAVGHRQFIKWARHRGATARVCMEATGVYSLPFALALHSAEGIDVSVVNPKAIKRFADASMQRGKTDAARSIGVRASAAIAANPATKLHLRISYATGF